MDISDTDSVADEHAEGEAVEASDQAGHTLSLFLQLPAELRNTIYRYALVDPNKIRISAWMTQPPQEPSILRVNRQTRQEALAIYYCENHFRFDVYNFDASGYIRWARAELARRGRLQVWFKLYAVTAPDIAWRNLMSWLEAIHHRKVLHGPSSRAFAGKKAHRVVAGELKEMAGSMQGQGLTWVQVVANLGYARKMLAARNANGQWMP